MWRKLWYKFIDFVWKWRNRKGRFYDQAQEIRYYYGPCPKCGTGTINKLCPLCGWNGITKFYTEKW